jgi:hypothetical protein
MCARRLTKDGTWENARRRTSSPSLIELPPQPGNSTRSPALTLVGTVSPCLLGAPGPTAMTVASGNGLLVAEDGKKMPVAVFYKYALAYTDPPKLQNGTDCLRLKTLDQNTVQ